MLDQVLDTIGALLLLVGAFLTVAAAIGLIRLPDVLTRMHAATKPQTLGLICAMVGVAIYMRDPAVTGWIVLAVVLQLLTAPIAAHMIGRTAYRTHQVRRDLLDIDELADDLSSAGFTLAAAPGGRNTGSGGDDNDDDHDLDDDNLDDNNGDLDEGDDSDTDGTHELDHTGDELDAAAADPTDGPDELGAPDSDPEHPAEPDTLVTDAEEDPDDPDPRSGPTRS